MANQQVTQEEWAIINATASVSQEFQDEVVPVVLPLELLIIRSIAVIFGIPIQLLVAFVILRSRQLYNPRNAFWLGNITCHFAILLMGVYEYWTVIFIPTISRTKIFCQIYTLFVGSPYTSLLMSLLLATADRWFAISNPIKHRKYVTVAGVAGCLITSWLLVLFILTSPYWTGSIPFPECAAINSSFLKWVAFSHFVIVGLIIVAQTAVYVKTRHYLRFRAHHAATTGVQQQLVDVLSSASNSSTLKPDKYFVHLPNKTICRLELEASVTLFCGVASLCVCTLPMGLVCISMVFCKLNPFQCTHDDVVAVYPYAREMRLLHSVISPLLYILRSREFAKALRRTFPSLRSFIQQDHVAVSPPL
jgi:hypothetical protein